MKTKPLLLLTLFVAITYLGCKKENTQAGILGVWTQTHSTVKMQFVFKSDLTFENDVLEIDSASKSTIGYRYKTVGTYTLQNTTLTLKSTQNYSNPDNSYGPESSLVAVNGQSNDTYTIGFNGQKNILYLYFTCPPNANCVPSPLVYTKQ
ncbi:MAG TPA: hypothetical protein VIM89_18580 [Mucilaginibacter sp.]